MEVRELAKVASAKYSDSESFRVTDPGLNYPVKIKPTKTKKVCSNIQKFWSFRFIATFLFSAFILFSSVCIWGIGFASSYFAIAENSERASVATRERVTEKTKSYFSQMEDALKLVRNRYLMGELIEGVDYVNNASQHEDFTTSLYGSILDTSSLFMVVVGNIHGDFIGVERYGEGLRTLATRQTLLNESSGEYVNRLEWFHLNEKTRTNEYNLDLENENYYDPRARGWYTIPEKGVPTNASAFDIISWVPIFLTVTIPQKLSVMACKKIVTQEGAFVGVLGVLYNLDQLSVYLQALPYISYIMQEDGILIASSTINDYEAGVYATTSVLKAHEHPNLIVAETSEYLVKTFGSYEAIRTTEATPLTFWTSDARVKQVDIAQYEVSGKVLRTVVVSDMVETHRITLYSTVASILATFFFILIALVSTYAFGMYVSKVVSIIGNKLSNIANFNFEKDESRVDKNVSWHLNEFRTIEGSFQRMIEGLKQFEKFLPDRNVIRGLISEEENSVCHIRSKYLTLLFVDIENFSYISEQVLSPPSLVKMLQLFFTKMEVIINIHNGVIYKFIGDAIFCIFNAPRDCQNHEYEACACALEMVKVARMTKIDETAGKNLEVRVGINSSRVLVGTIGTMTRRSFTALGDGVNIAARFEKLNKEYGTRIMCGETTYNKVKKVFKCRWLDCVELRGKLQKTNVYEVMETVDNATESQKEDSACSFELFELMQAKKYQLAKDLLYKKEMERTNRLEPFNTVLMNRIESELKKEYSV